MYDVAIIGSGPGGYAAALKVAKLGKRAVLFEKQALGGVCLNRGCIPTKALLKSAEVMQSVQESGRYGVLSQLQGIDYAAVTARKDGVVKRLSGGVGAMLRSHGVEVVMANAKLVGPRTIQAGGEAYEARNVILAMGSRPAMPPIPGIDLPHVITSDGLLALEQLPRSIAIIGGGVIGLEFALILSQFGCATTVIEALDALIPMADADISQFAGQMLKQKGVRVECGARVLEITEGGLTFERGGRHEIDAEMVLIAVGRRANIEGLDELGIRCDGAGVIVDTHMQTNVQGVYAIGDLNGRSMLAHVASREAGVAANHIAGIADAMDYASVPQCVYSHPEIAWVGLTERAAKDEGYDVQVVRSPLAANGKAIAEGSDEGFVKLVLERETRAVLGAHIAAPSATEMIAELVLAMNLEAGAEELAHAIHPHPAVAESIQMAAEAALGI